MTPAIGFDRRIPLDWLEQAATVFGQGGDPRHQRRLLAEALFVAEEGASRGGQASLRRLSSARRKDVTVLSRIWLEPRSGGAPLRQGGVAHLEHLLGRERVLVHYGLSLATYPFFAACSRAIGRSLMLADEVTLVGLTRRLAEALGERTTLRRAVQRVVVSLLDWSILRPGSRPGTYGAGEEIPVTDPDLAAWLLRAALVADPGKALELSTVGRLPLLFPVRLAANLGGLARAPGLRVYRQGVDQEVVELAEASDLG